MGVCSTMFITRKDALKLLKRFLKDCDDKMIEEILYDLVGSEFSHGQMLRNFTIVSEYDPANRDRNYKEKPNESDSTL